MMAALPNNIKAKMVSQINDDPGLPVSKPTTSSWQLPPHPLSELRSERLVPVIDFVIIGSGITGCSVAKYLVENSDKRVTVFEARSLTSGATGRNGGHLASHLAKEFKSVVARDGRDAAIRVARYCLRTLAKVAELAFAERVDSSKSSQIRSVEEIMAFADRESLTEALESIHMYEDLVTEEEGTYSFLSEEVAKADFHLRKCVGIVSMPGHALWPYRLVTNLFQQLVDRYSHRFSIETRTPVTAIEYDFSADNAHPYVVITPRGNVRCAQIFHCANAFTGHLLPNLRGKVFPYRGTMSCQSPGSGFPNLGSKYLWLFYKTPIYDADCGTFDGKLFYMHQNAETGNVFCGGDKRQLDEIFTSDDGVMSSTAKDNLSLFVSKRFESPWSQPGTEGTEIHEQWSGIIGLTPDGFPLVGKVPQSISGRAAGDGEWIAAGFNGYGMSQCWSCGEAIGRTALGEPMPEWLPEICVMSESRLADERRMSSEAFLDAMFGKK